MSEFFEILWPILIFAGLVFGVVLAIASKIFFVKTEESVAKITEVLPGANCGGCGYAGCAQLAQAIADGKAPVTACTAGGPEVANKIAEALGKSEKSVANAVFRIRTKLRALLEK